MPALQYVGKSAGVNPDLAYRDYAALVKGADLSVAEIDNVINAGLAGYALIGYVDTRDALNATKAYVDAGDAARLRLAQKTIANGVCPLDATGRVPPTRIDAPLTQKWLRGPWTPPAYHAAPVNVATTETTLYTCPVTDPGYPYKLVVFGMLDARSDRETEYPLVNVRVGATTGEIIAQGVGSLDVADASAPTSGEKFSVPNATGLEPDLWNSTLISGSGGFYKVESGQATWTGGGDPHWRFRRLGPDAVTATDYQKVRLTIGSDIGSTTWLGASHAVRLSARMNSGETDWVGFALTHNVFYMQYCLDDVITNVPASGTAGWTVTPSPNFATDPATGTHYDILAGTNNSLRQFLFFRNNVLIGGAVDGNAVTKLGTGYRGWGWDAQAATGMFSVAAPPAITELLITDAPPSFGSVSIVPVPSATVRTGSTMLYLRGARSGAASTVAYTPYKPRLTVFAVPA